MSPEVGELRDDAFDDALRDDPDQALAMLADLAGATDERLRRLARRLAGRVIVDIGRRGAGVRSGVGRMAAKRYGPDAGDLDLDISSDPILIARATNSVPDLDELRVRGWVRPGTAISLLVDRSGSMGGAPLASSAVAAAVVAWRAPSDYSVLAFGNDVVAAKSQDVDKDAERVVTDVLTLRGYGTTDVAGALLSAGAQLARSRAGRKITVLLSDCRATVEGDVIAAAAGLDELVIVAPEGDCDEAAVLARAVGARLVMLRGPSDVPRALTEAFDR